MDGQILTVAANWTDHEAACQLVEATKGEMLITNYAEHKPGVLQPYEVQVVLYDDKD